MIEGGKAMTDSGDLLDFKMALRRFMQETCATLSETGIAIRRWIRIVREEKGWSFPEEEHPDYSETSFLLMRKLHEEPPDSLLRVMDIVGKVPDLANVLLVDAGGNPIREEKMQLWWVTNMLARFIHDYLEKATEGKFDEKAFNTVFDHLRQDIQSPTITVKELSPLMNASMDCERITIAPHLALRKLTVNELEKWHNDYLRYPFFSVHSSLIGDVTQLDCAMEVTYKKQRKEAWGSNQEIRTSADDLVTTLRLLTDKNIYIAFTVHGSDSILQPGGGTSSSLRPRLLGQSANIGASLQQDIIDTWNHIRSLPNQSPVRLALRRWNTVFERFDEDDALIDYWIALEGLFVPDTFQELRHRSAFRIGAYLGETPDQREHIYKELLDSYDLRSKIVHGGVPTNKRKTALINITRSYLRRALVQILSSIDRFDPRTIEIERLRK